MRAITILAVLFLLANPLLATEEALIGHISFVENSVTVVRNDQTENPVTVNLPIVPGDTIYTFSNSRCELQFANGTVIRLDKNTRLGVTTVLAAALTSSWKVTTLKLMQGQVYTLPQAYHREMFQIITPNAAVNLKSRTAATIQVGVDHVTTLFADWGKFEVLYGAVDKSPKRVIIRSGPATVIGTDHSLVTSNEKKSLEFAAWNEYLNRHFKELHFGASKVPVNLAKFGNQALVHWAEKWSSLAGEWIYDDIFGYVWKPADESFAQAVRPFFHADYVRVNGQLFLVPQQAWGWVPAHLGTWVWLKQGWTWIPGDWFHSGIVDFQSGYTFPTLDYYFWFAYGNYDLYQLCREKGLDAWQAAFRNTFGSERKRPALKDLPRELQGIIRQVNASPLAATADRLDLNRTKSPIDAGKLPPAKPLPAVSQPAPKAPLAEPHSLPAATLMSDTQVRHGLRSAGKLNAVLGGGRGNPRLDWNPDSRWAAENGLTIIYSSAKNAVCCPELNIFSKRTVLANRIALQEYAQGERNGTAQITHSAGSKTQVIHSGNATAGGRNAGVQETGRTISPEK